MKFLHLLTLISHTHSHTLVSVRVQMSAALGSNAHHVKVNPISGVLYCEQCGAEKGEPEFMADCTKAPEGMQAKIMTE